MFLVCLLDLIYFGGCYSHGKPQGNAMTDMQKMKWLAQLSIPISLFVFVLKYLAWTYTGTVALYSDALESAINVAAALVAWWTIRLGMKPADLNHPFGHYKAEYFSAGFEGSLIILAAFLIFYEAIRALEAPSFPQEPDVGLVITLLSLIINILWGTLLIRAGKHYNSPALKADGYHLISDVVTSFTVFVGLIITLWSDWTPLDSCIAIFIACYILSQGWKIINNSVQGLMDISVSPKDMQKIRSLVSLHAFGALEAHDLRTRIAGRVIFVEFHLVVPSTMTVEKAHVLCDHIEQTLQSEMNHTYIIIHVEPENEAKLSQNILFMPFPVPFA